MTDLWMLMVKRLSILTTNMSFVRCTILLTFCVLVTVQSMYTQTTLSSILVLRGRLTLLNTCDGYDRVLRMVSHRQDLGSFQSQMLAQLRHRRQPQDFLAGCRIGLGLCTLSGLTEAFEMMVEILLREETLTILLFIYKAPHSFMRKGAKRYTRARAVEREPCTI
jgi:hypothetical protein